MNNLPSIGEIDKECTFIYEICERFTRSGGEASTQVTFDYAARKSDVEEGLKMIKQIYAAVKERRKECLYYAALGHYKLKQYSDARNQIDILTRIEPDNQQVKLLRNIIEDAVRVQGVVGLAIVSGVVAVVGVAIGSLFRR